MDGSPIRNFVIIAHIDHGKSTLADRLLEATGTVEKRKMREQFLDQMDLEREKGITIKMQPVRMVWRPPSHAESQNVKFEISSPEYILNLIDTPGHVDFSYEVSRALAAVEGAILLVDATQGVQAQTIANLALAKGEGLAIIPAVNKIDLDAARVEETIREFEQLLGSAPEDVLRISGKTGEGVPELLAAIVERIPSPDRSFRTREASAIPRALIFDSHFDAYRGIVAHVRVFDGTIRRGDRITLCATGAATEVMELGTFVPAMTPGDALIQGAIGYIATGLKEPDAVRVGDTILAAAARESEGDRAARFCLPGYREPKPMVFASIYPEEADDYLKLTDALKKIQLNDASLFFEAESSDALGRGFRAGFLGMLHMEITSERLAREYGIRLVMTTPSVAYRVILADGTELSVYSAARLPDGHTIREIREPWVRLEVMTPEKFIGGVMELLKRTRGIFVNQRYVGTDRIEVTYEVPLRDILVDFFDGLKSITEGYGSLGYEFLGERIGDLTRLDILIAGEREEALSQAVPKARAYMDGRAFVGRLKTLLPKQLFAVSLQAVVDGRVLARETIPALKKDVTGYLYGGDRTRKMKLWKKQQRGKKRLEAGGRVEIPPDVFLKILKQDSF